MFPPALGRLLAHAPPAAIGQGGDYVNCEVKINGNPHSPSAAALAAMNWPRTAQMSTARVFLLLVHPDGDDGR
jgi:hypothetical protein